MSREGNKFLQPYRSLQQTSALRVRKLRKFEDSAELRESASNKSQEFCHLAAKKATLKELQEFNPLIAWKSTMEERMDIISNEVTKAIPTSQELTFLKILRNESCDEERRGFFCNYIINSHPHILDKIIELLSQDRPVQVLIEGAWVICNLAYLREDIQFTFALGKCKPLLRCLVKVLAHQDLNVRLQALWAFINILSDVHLDQLRLYFFENHDILEAAISLIDYEDPPLSYIKIGLWSIGVMLSPYDELESARTNHVRKTVMAILRHVEHPEIIVFRRILKILLLLIQKHRDEMVKILIKLKVFKILLWRGLQHESSSIVKTTLQLVSSILQSRNIKVQYYLVHKVNLPVIVEDRLDYIRALIMGDKEITEEIDMFVIVRSLNVLSEMPIDDDFILHNFQHYSMYYALFYLCAKHLIIRKQCVLMIRNFLKYCRREHMDNLNLSELMQHLLAQVRVLDSEVVMISIECIDFLLEFGVILKEEGISESNLTLDIFQHLGGPEEWACLVNHQIEEVSYKAKCIFEKYGPPVDPQDCLDSGNQNGLNQEVMLKLGPEHRSMEEEKQPILKDVIALIEEEGEEMRNKSSSQTKLKLESAQRVIFAELENQLARSPHLLAKSDGEVAQDAMESNSLKDVNASLTKP